MNMIFGFLLLAIPSGLLYAALRVLYRHVYAPRWVKNNTGLVIIIVLVVMSFSTLRTYSPKLELAQPHVYQPQQQDVKTETVFIQSVDRVGQFDQRIEEEKPN